MFKKLFFIFFIGFFLVSPSLVLGAGVGSTVPQLNPLCWKKSECIKARQDFFNITDKEKLNAGCVEETPCKGSVGSSDVWCKCLAAGETATNIAIGGKKSFANLGVYLLTVYDYALKIAGIIAVLVIIVAGVQWMVSGGNSSIIEASKKRILGAFVGLFIAYGSFFILNTINPALVNLRLPQTWMVKPAELIPEFCSDLFKDDKKKTSEFKFARAAAYDDQKSTIDFSKISKYPLVYEFDEKRASGLSKTTETEFFCGRRYAIEDQTDSVCFGDSCASVKDPQSHACIPAQSEKSKTTMRYGCYPVTIYGRITCQSFVSEVACWLKGWQYPDMTDADENELWLLCKDGNGYDLNADSKTTQLDTYQDYTINVNKADLDKNIKNYCGSEDKVAGFVVMFEMQEHLDPTDESHYIGLDNGKAVDLGDTPWFFDYAGETGLKFKLIGNGRYNTNIDSKYFISLKDIRAGIKMSIDAKTINDIDTTDKTMADKLKIYQKYMKK